MDRLGPKAVKDIRNFLDKELDNMKSKIGFVPIRETISYFDDVSYYSDDAFKNAFKDSIIGTEALFPFVEDLFNKAHVRSIKASPEAMAPVFESLNTLEKNVNNLKDIKDNSFKETEKLGSRDEKNRRVKAFHKAIEDRAKEFNYTPKELLDAYKRLENHLKGSYPYMRDSAHSSQAQASRAIIKAAINQIPNLEKIYGEPVVGFVFPARTDLQNMSGRAYLQPDDGSARYLEELAKHKKAGLTSYEVAPNIVKKQFQDALLDEAGNPQVEIEENVIFNMVDKDGNRTARLPNPVQYILKLDEGSAGEKLAKSKFVFKAKGGTVDLRKAG